MNDKYQCKTCQCYSCDKNDQCLKCQCCINNNCFVDVEENQCQNRIEIGD